MDIEIRKRYGRALKHALIALDDHGLFWDDANWQTDTPYKPDKLEVDVNWYDRARNGYTAEGRRTVAEGYVAELTKVGLIAAVGTNFRGAEMVSVDITQPDFETKLQALIDAHKDQIIHHAQKSILSIPVGKISLDELSNLIPINADGSALEPASAAQTLATHARRAKELMESLGVKHGVDALLSPRGGRALGRTQETDTSAPELPFHGQ